MKQGKDIELEAADVQAQRPLSPQAQRALDEARQRQQAKIDDAQAKEVHGRGGLEPVRFGDWEIKGLATDF